MINNTFHDQVLRRLIESGSAFELAVVISTEEAEVLDVGRAAVFPAGHVVGLDLPPMRWTPPGWDPVPNER
jgi:hypothetical protein